MAKSSSPSDEARTPSSCRAIARRATLSLAIILTTLLILLPVTERAIIGEDAWPPLHAPIPFLVHGVLVNPWLTPVAAIIAWIAWIIVRNGAKPPRPAPKPVWILLSILTVVILTIESAAYALTATVINYHVLTPTSSTGCTVIATYTTGMWASYGDFLIVPNDGIIPRPTNAGWAHSDGSYNHPFADPSWTVTWNGNEATITTSDDPQLVSIYGTPVQCE